MSETNAKVSTGMRVAKQEELEYKFMPSHSILRDTYIFLLFHTPTVWPEILAGNLFWRIGGFESNPPIFHPPNSCSVMS